MPAASPRMTGPEQVADRLSGSNHVERLLSGGKRGEDPQAACGIGKLHEFRRARPVIAQQVGHPAGRAT